MKEVKLAEEGRVAEVLYLHASRKLVSLILTEIDVLVLHIILLY